MTTGHFFSARSICAFAALAALASGCESEDPSEIQSYVDDAGRSCSVDLADITHTATCDADPSEAITCTSGEPVFVMHDSYDFDTEIHTRLSCTACIVREQRMTYIGECVTVSCETNDDCLNREGDVRPFVCTSGICTHD